MAADEGADARYIAVYDSPDPEMMTGEAVALDVRPASFILRGAGSLIDWISYGLLLFGIVASLGALAEASNIDQALFTALTIVALVVVVVILPTIVETATRGRSLGKLAVGLRVVRDDGGAISFRHAFIRSLTAVFEIVMTFGGVAAITALLNGRAKRMGDLLAGTYAQQERVPRVVEPVFGVPVELTEWATLADVGKLPDALSRRITAFLKQASQLTAVSRERLSRELAREAAPYVSPVPNVHAELFLAGVAAIRRDRDYAALTLAAERMKRLDAVLNGLPNSFPDR